MLDSAQAVESDPKSALKNDHRPPSQTVQMHTVSADVQHLSGPWKSFHAVGDVATLSVCS